MTYIPAGIIFVLICALLMYAAKKISYSVNNTDWEIWFICECGQRCHAAYGNKWFIQNEICSKCGISKSTWRRTTGKYVDGIFEELKND